MIQDRSVEVKFSSLALKKIDFVVSGSIACVESVRMVRALRRRGADVRVWMTSSAAALVSPQIFEWASAQDVILGPSGRADHITSRDAVVVAPCTLNMLAKINLGIADSAASTLVQSALGRLPVVILPAMHESLQNEKFEHHKKELSQISGLVFAEGRQEEGKIKAPDPDSFADFVSHQILSNKKRVLVLFGPTRSYVDDVRFLSNHSSGRTGSFLCDFLFRQGFQVAAIMGPCAKEPSDFVEKHKIETAEEMLRTAQDLLESAPFDLVIFAAAVLDFEISKLKQGKISSSESLELSLKPSLKILDHLNTGEAKRMAFKLESQLTDSELKERVRAWIDQKQLDYVAANHLQDAKSNEHKFWFYKNSDQSWLKCESHMDLATQIQSLI